MAVERHPWSISSVGLERRAYRVLSILMSREGLGFNPRIDQITTPFFSSFYDQNKVDIKMQKLIVVKQRFFVGNKSEW